MKYSYPRCFQQAVVADRFDGELALPADKSAVVDLLDLCSPLLSDTASEPDKPVAYAADASPVVPCP